MAAEGCAATDGGTDGEDPADGGTGSDDGAATPDGDAGVALVQAASASRPTTANRIGQIIGAR
jgi:hypothetical protein